MAIPNVKLFFIALFDLVRGIIYRQTYFIILLTQKSPTKRKSIFDLKSWVNPFGKIQYGLIPTKRNSIFDLSNMVTPNNKRITIGLFAV